MLFEEGASGARPRRGAELFVIECGQHGDARRRGQPAEGGDARVHRCQVVQPSTREEGVVLAEHGSASGIGDDGVESAHVRRVDTRR